MQSTIMWDGFAVCSSKNEEWHDGCDDVLCCTWCCLYGWLTLIGLLMSNYCLFFPQTADLNCWVALCCTSLWRLCSTAQRRLSQTRVWCKGWKVRLWSCVYGCLCVNGCVRAWIISDGVDCEEWTVWKVHKKPYAGNYIYRDSPWLESVNVIYTVTTAEGQK